MAARHPVPHATRFLARRRRALRRRRLIMFHMFGTGFAGAAEGSRAAGETVVGTKKAPRIGFVPIRGVLQL